MDDPIRSQVEQWQQWPLCRKYLVVEFESCELRRENAAHSFGVVQWVLGTLGTGESEVLWIWSGQVVDWQPVVDNLWARGVESIRFAVVAEAEPLTARFAAAIVARSVADLLTDLQATRTCGRRTRRAVVAAIESSRRVRERSSRHFSREAIASLHALQDRIAHELRRWERDGRRTLPSHTADMMQLAPIAQERAGHKAAGQQISAGESDG